MMPRIYIRDQNDEVLDTLDEGQYFDDNMQRFLKGKATVLSFTIVKTEDSYALMTAGRNLSFRFDEEDFWLSCVIVEQDETYLTVTAWSLGLELNNETHGPYKAPKAMTFAEYLAVIDIERILTLGINEVSDKKISHEWEGTESKLSRLYSLATVFNAEISFDTELNEDGSLKQISLNVYREHSDADQGLGQDRRNETFYFGEDIKTIRKTEDTSDLYTAIFATGKDGLTIAGIEKEVFDEDGNLLFATYKTQKPGFADPRKLYAPQARYQFPSNTTGGDRWTLNTAGEFEYESAEALLGYMMSELKKNCQPATTWEIEGYIKAKIGDTVRIADEGYKPTLYLEARVIEQEISFSDKTKNKSTFSNVVELESQVDSSLLDRVQALIDANKTYQYSISTDNGIVFKNNIGTTTLTATVRDGVADVTGDFSIAWFKDGVAVGTGVSITVQATEIVEKAVYRFETSRDGNVVGGYEVTVSDVTDGEEGFSPIVTPNDNGTITIVDKEGEKTTPDLTGPQGPPGEVDQELIDEITNTAEDAKKAGEAAQAAAEQAEADSALAVENANNAVNKANEASAKADQSQQAADQAKSDATDAAGKAQSALDSATTALEGVEGVKTDLTTEVTRIDGQLSTKVETTVFNSLKGTVTSQGTQINQNTNDIKLKANQTEVDSIAGRVTSTESQLTMQAGTISALNTLTDGHTAQIGNLTASFDGLSSTVSKVQTDLDGKATITDFSNLSQTVSVIQGTVANKAEQSQVTQLAGQITSIVSDVSNIKAVGTNLWAPSYYASNQYYIDASGGTVANTTYLSTNHILVGSNKSVMVSVFEYTGATTGRIVVAFYNGTTFISRSQINPNTTTESQVTFPAGTTRIAFSAPIAGRYKFEFGVKATDYSVSPLDTATTSQITQLADRMNFRITNSDGSITQIDLANKVISLSGEQVNITGNTYIENGVIKTAAIADAAITNAKIGSLSADKVTVGTLNGANVNIINLNASNIVSGEISGINIRAATFYGTSTSGAMQLNGTDLRFDTTTNSFRLNYGGISNINNTYGTRNITFFSEGIEVASGASNTGNYKNSGVRVNGNTAYLDLFSAKSVSTTDYATRLVAETNGNFGVLNPKGLVYISSPAAINLQPGTSVSINKPLEMGGNNINGANNLIGSTSTGGSKVNMINIQGSGSSAYLNITSGSTSWGVTMWTSDMRLKTNIQKAPDNGLELVDQLMVRAFDWRDSDRHTDYGLIAQNVERVLPQAVFEVSQPQSEAIKQISVEGLMPIVVKAIQELKQEINTLKETI